MEWISVKDRCPHKECNVRAKLKCAGGVAQELTLHYCPTACGVDERLGFFQPMGWDVTHWMSPPPEGSD